MVSKAVNYGMRIMHSYPHMLPEDAAIWTRYLKKPLYQFDAVYYDVHVGSSLPVSPDSPVYLARVARGIYRKRIDVVAEFRGTIWVIELKPRASHAAIGQVLYYSDAYRREIQPGRPVVPVIITDVVDPDIKPLANELGIVIIEAG